MNYRHLYHAGNFADVFKHIVLVSLLQALKQKEKAFCYLDTHAGIGRYDLFSEQAQKTQEYALGIAKLFQKTEIPYPEVQEYLDIVKSINSHGELHYYPGSPYIASILLRPQDRMILCELHPEDARTLKQEFQDDPQVAVHLQDGYLGMKAFLPPKENRGLVFIDPPFEKPSETADILTAMEIALKRWVNGIYAIWYPIKEPLLIDRFQKKLRTLTTREILFTEFHMGEKKDYSAFTTMGIAIINPPWQFEERLSVLKSWLHNILV